MQLFVFLLLLFNQLLRRFELGLQVGRDHVNLAGAIDREFDVQRLQRFLIIYLA